MKISLRKANFSDIEFLWYLRNQPDVYKYFRNGRVVSWKEHINWVLPIILGKQARDIYIIQQNSLPVGQIRFDYEKDKKAIVSISVLEEFRQKGISTKAFRKAISLLKKTKRRKALIAEVYKNNIASLKFFEGLNFKIKEKRKNLFKYILKI